MFVSADKSGSRFASSSSPETVTPHLPSARLCLTSAPIGPAVQNGGLKRTPDWGGGLREG